MARSTTKSSNNSSNNVNNNSSNKSNNSNSRKPTANSSQPTASKNNSGEDAGGVDPETFWIWGGFGGRGACACACACGLRVGGEGVFLGEVKAHPRDIICFSWSYLSKSKVPTSNSLSSPTSLDTPARPADFHLELHSGFVFVLLQSIVENDRRCPAAQC